MDKGVVISAFTRDQGRHAGFAYKSAIRDLDAGALGRVHWEARVSDMLGLYKEIYLDKAIAPLVMNNASKLILLQSLCAMCDSLLPEREPHIDLYDASANFLEQLIHNDEPLVLGATYVMWEIMLLKALGYGLDLSECAQTKTSDDLIYVSPKSGRAVSAEAGEPYKERLLKLPSFLRPVRDGDLDFEDIKNGLLLTQTFFEKWVLTHMSKNLPVVRARVSDTLERACHR